MKSRVFSAVFILTDKCASPWKCHLPPLPEMNAKHKRDENKPYENISYHH